VRPAERILLGYFGIILIVGVMRLPGQPAIAWVLVAHALCIGLVLLTARAGAGPFGRTIRELYPLLLLGALYPALDILNSFGAVSTHDTTVRGWEQALFGVELSRAWWQSAPSVFWSTVLHAAYFAYYPIIIGPLIYFVARGELVATRRTTLWVLCTFLICYLVFLFYPVAGPYYEFPRPAAWFLANLPARLVYATLAKGSAYGAAFPSSHVAATLVATAAAWRGSRRVGALLVVPAGLLTAGVVYCQMHYGVDALAGIMLATAIIAIGWWGERHRGPDRGLPRPDPR
jgi:membrane-associated phospholipid phosphatase